MKTVTQNFGYVLAVLDLEPHLRGEAQALRAKGRLIGAEECERIANAIAPPFLHQPYDQALNAIESWVRFEITTALFRGAYQEAAALERIATLIKQRGFVPEALRIRG